ncbi:leucine zipper transcription factor-like protein 1 [Ciona intestinalis]
MLDGLLSVVRGEMEAELLNASHTSVLQLRQILSQAEKWHLKLCSDISELENRELLEQIADFEEQELSLSGSSDFKPLPKLEPLNESGGVALLQMEIERLKEENERLNERSKSFEKHATKCVEDNKAMQKQIKELGAKPIAAVDNSSVSELETKLKAMKADFSESMDSKSALNEALAADLTSTKHDLLKVKEQLEMAEKDLEKKFRETGAFRNLRDMLAKKNEQLKELRKKLGKYEQTD